MRHAPYKFEGPFLGLNELADQRQLHPGYAAEAFNVLLTGGRIRPVPPLQPYRNGTILGFKLGGGEEDFHIVSLFHWERAWESAAIDPVLLIKAWRPSPLTQKPLGSIWLIGMLGAAQMLGPENRTALPAQFVVANHQVYIADGTYNLAKTDGYELFGVGVAPPTIPGIGWILDDEDTVALPMRRYAVTFYNYHTGVESNPLFFPTDGSYFSASTGKKHRFLLQYGSAGNRPPDNLGLTGVRFYRQNAELDQIFYRLIGYRSSNFNDVRYWSDTFAEDEITESDVITGPFAPQRNGLPPTACRTIGWHGQRMFFGGKDGRLWYSAVGVPDHVHELDYLNVTGDAADAITGLATDAGQLIIGKPRSIWKLGGSIYGPTNETMAVGILAPESAHELYKTRSDVGPSYGGFVRAGLDGALHFGAPEGWFSFNGQESFCLSPAIGATWGRLIRRGSGSANEAFLTFAHDPENRVVFIANAHDDGRSLSDPRYVEGPHVVAWHYGLPGPNGPTHGWSVLGYEHPQQGTVWRCVAQPLGDIVPLIGQEGAEGVIGYRPALALIGDVAGNIWILAYPRLDGSPEVLANDGEACRWRWRTGELVPHKGGRFHVYRVYWLCGRVGSDYEGNLPEVEFRATGNGGRLPTSTKESDLAGRPRVCQRLGRTVEDITLGIVSGQGWLQGWCRDLGVTGFEIEYEPAGT